MGRNSKRMESARDELKRIIMQLDQTTMFNIILFETAIRRWSTGALVFATRSNKGMACRFLDQQCKATGGTNTVEAMEEALEKVALVKGAETVFLLTDGMPNSMAWGRSTSGAFRGGHDDIRRRIKFLNQTLKVRINTIGINPGGFSGGTMEKFLKGIADENDGVYKPVN